MSGNVVVALVLLFRVVSSAEASAALDPSRGPSQSSPHFLTNSTQSLSTNTISYRSAPFERSTNDGPIAITSSKRQKQTRRQLDDGATSAGSCISDGTVSSAQTVLNGNGDLPFTLDDEDLFGSAVTTIGDLNGDGVIDLAVGATGDDDGDQGAGRMTCLVDC